MGVKKLKFFLSITVALKIKKNDYKNNNIILIIIFFFTTKFFL